MRKIFLVLTFTLILNYLFSQNKEEAEILVTEGIELYDQGNYEDAVLKFDSALRLDENNLPALTEKALALFSLGSFTKAIENCRLAIAKHPGEQELGIVYSIYGNATDELNKPQKALEIYNEGIKFFPDFYLLYFNKGITLTRMNKPDEALMNFQKTVSLAPDYASAQNTIARALQFENKRIPAILAYSRFLILEPSTKRAKENLQNLENLMKRGVEKKDEKDIIISIDPGQRKKDKKPKENDFSATDIILTFATAADYSGEHKDKSEVDQFIRKFEVICASLKENQQESSGFYWKYYVPYFLEMQDRNLLNTFGYLVFASSDDILITTWLQLHEKEIDEFYDWSEAFQWNTN